MMSLVLKMKYCVHLNRMVLGIPIQIWTSKHMVIGMCLRFLVFHIFLPHFPVCFHSRGLKKVLFKVIDVCTYIVYFQCFLICINGFLLILFVVSCCRAFITERWVECPLSVQSNKHKNAGRYRYSMSLGVL